MRITREQFEADRRAIERETESCLACIGGGLCASHARLLRTLREELHGSRYITDAPPHQFHTDSAGRLCLRCGLVVTGDPGAYLVSRQYGDAYTVADLAKLPPCAIGVACNWCGDVTYDFALEEPPAPGSEHEVCAHCQRYDSRAEALDARDDINELMADVRAEQPS